MRSIETFTKKVKQLEENDRTIKRTQFIGQDSLLSYRTYSSNQFDYHFVISESATIRYFRLTFTNAVSSNNSLITLTAFARDTNPDVMASPIPYATNTAPTIRLRWRKEAPTVTGQTSWVIQVIKGLSGINSFDAYIKFFFDGTDTGTWTIQEI